MQEKGFNISILNPDIKLEKKDRVQADLSPRFSTGTLRKSAEGIPSKVVFCDKNF